MKLNFCTLFDSNFLVSGYTLYISLQKCCKNFHLYIFAFDDLAFEVLTQLHLPNVTVISLSEFEDEELLRIKPTRSKGEYCWTCTSSTIKYCIETFHLDHCTYLDADLFFYGDPEDIIQDINKAGKDVLITKHNYTKKHERLSIISGIYCVQFMFFRNTVEGMEVLNWWRNACIDWCFNRHEDGKFGDQKYLDDWPSRFPCVHVSTMNGAGLASWNSVDYHIVEQPSQKNPFKLVNNKKKTECDLIFFHFHKFRLSENDVVWTRAYNLPKSIIKHIYIPYTNLCLAHYEYLHQVNQNIVLPQKSSWMPRSFFSSTLFFLISIPYCLWKEKSLIIEFNNYHVYKIKNGKLIRS